MLCTSTRNILYHTAHPGQSNRNFGAVSSIRTDCSRPKIRPGIRIRAQNRAESSGYGRKLHAKSSQSLSLAGRPAGGWLAGHAIGCKSQWDSHYENKKILTQPESRCMVPGCMGQAAHDDAAGRHVLKSFSGYRTALSNRPTQYHAEFHSAWYCVEFFRQKCDTGLQYVQM